MFHAYLLHHRPYRETSLLADFFVAEVGRVTAVWRGAKRGKKVPAQLFQPLLVEFSGQHELKNVQSLEPASSALLLQGKTLFSAFYVNELLMRILPKEEVLPNLFYHYAHLLGQFAEGDALEPLLRRFEWELLQGVGYGIDFLHDGEKKSAILPHLFYDYIPGLGFLARKDQQGIAGHIVQALAQSDLIDPTHLSAAKWINRRALQPLLGQKPLKSRELFLINKG